MSGLVKRVFLVGLGFQLLAGAMIFSSPLASAASTSTSPGSNLTTSPISVDLTANPGATTSTTLQVLSNNPAPIGISVKLEEFKANGQDGQAQIFEAPTGDQSLQWVHFSQTSFTAQPGVWNPVTMTIQVPKTAAFGYYYAVLFVPSNSIANGNTEKVKGANAILVLLNAYSPNENNRLSVSSFSADRSSYQYLPASFKVVVHNNGNIYTAPAGDIFISRTKTGKVIDTLPINSGSGQVLPQTSRAFQVKWNDGFPVYQPKRLNGQILSDKKGQPAQELHWDITKASKFRFGRYYARLVVVYNDDGRQIAVNGLLSFWVIPWPLVAGLLLFLGLVFLGFWTIIRGTLRKAKSLKTGKKS